MNPVQAVYLNNRENLIVALQPTYGHHEDEENNNFAENIANFVEVPSSDPNDWNKGAYPDIFSYFQAEDLPYDHHPLDDSTNNNEVKLYIIATLIY